MWARTFTGVSIVSAPVQLAKDGKVIRVHPIRHDRSRELGAFANPTAGPPRTNPAIGYAAQLPELTWSWWLRVGLFPWWGPVPREAERQPGVVFDALSDVEFRGLGSVPPRSESECAAGSVGQGQIGAEAVLEVLDQPEVFEAQAEGE